ncbi:MAG: cob(I)yrinic acid a,c-diamide adenosyltransferase [Chloroflexota bacterium]
MGRGDSGYTDLFGPERVPKYDARVEAYGTIDEATSALGIARAASRAEHVQALLVEVQQDLYLIMAELATPANLREKLGLRLEAADVERIDAATRAIEGRVPLPKKFILPGACAASAGLDFARAVIRRAERQVAKLIHEGVVDNEEILRYLNRASSLLFVAARDEEYSQGIPFSLAERRQR